MLAINSAHPIAHQSTKTPLALHRAAGLRGLGLGRSREFIPVIDFSSFGNVADSGVWDQVHEEGVQIVENIVNIRVPVIAAVEGRAHVYRRSRKIYGSRS